MDVIRTLCASHLLLYSASQVSNKAGSLAFVTNSLIFSVMFTILLVREY